MKYFLTILSACLLILYSCTETSNKKSVTISQAFKPSPLDSAYSPIRPRVQTFTINTSRSNTVTAINGTQLLIPADCFTTAEGKSVEGTVQVEVIETTSLNDFVTAGLATVSNGRILESNGMMYINARSGNDPVEIKEGSSITVSMPTLGAAGEFKMFRGDGKNWNQDGNMSKEEYLISLPLDIIYPEGNKFFWYCIENAGQKGEKYWVQDSTIVSVTDKKYENTIIATEEFKSRYYYLRSMTEKISLFVNRDNYFDDQLCSNQKFNYDIWKIYFDHPNRSLKESDSIARKLYIDYFNSNKKKIETFCNEVNKNYSKHYYKDDEDTLIYFDFRKQSLEDWYMEVVRGFNFETKELKTINTHGVDLNAANAYEQLNDKGVSAQEINELLEYNLRRNVKIKNRQRYNEIDSKKEKLSAIYETTVFSVTIMGWINCDRFWDDPSAGKAEIYITNSSGANLDFIDCSLVIPDMKVRLSSFPAENGIYSFTKKEGPYTMLPIGREAVIVGVSMQHDSTFFAYKKINIKDGLRIGLPMQYIKSEALKDSLALALK